MSANGALKLKTRDDYIKFQYSLDKSIPYLIVVSLLIK